MEKEKQAGEQAMDFNALCAIEKSAVFSNLARGCEKQYLPGEAGLFRELEVYYRGVSEAEAGAGFDTLLQLTQEDLDGGIAAAMAVCREEGDRGAQRALVWHEKVSRIHKSLLSRYAQKGDAMTEGVSAFVCSACGFIYMGQEPPAMCPVCKVPAWKFDRVERKAVK